MMKSTRKCFAVLWRSSKDTSKSNVLQIYKMDGQQVMNIKWEGVKLEQVQSMEYLRTLINDDRRVDEEINNRTKVQTKYCTR
jgi:hypothetical protein